MRCKRLEDKIVSLAFGELDSRETARVEQHLRECPNCARLAASYRMTADIVRSPQEAPAGFLSSERLRQEILSRELKSPAPSFRLAWVGAAAAVAVGVFALANTMFFQSPATNDNDVHVAIGNGAVPAPAGESSASIELDAQDPVIAAESVAPAPRDVAVTSPSPVRYPRPSVSASAANEGGEHAPPEVHFASGPVTQDRVHSQPEVVAESEEVIVILPSAGAATEVKSEDVAFGG